MNVIQNEYYIDTIVSVDLYPIISCTLIQS